MSTIKINRAARLSSLSNYPRTWDDTIKAIPQEVCDALTSRQLAALVDAMRRQYDLGHSAGHRDATA